MFKLPYVRPGEVIPLGISRYRDGIRVRIPLFAWVRRGYLIQQDQFARGWWRLDVCAGSDPTGLFLRWSWVFVRGAVESVA